MDRNAIYQLFVASYHPDPNVRKQAELNIRNIESQQGFLPLILQIQASEDIEVGTRQAAAIYFKNRIHKIWENADTIPLEDKDVIKSNILNALTTAPPAVQVQLTASLNTILTNDFPEHWPTFINELEKYLTSDDIHLVRVGLLALREVVKVYQWKSGEKREPLREMIRLTFPVIQVICQKLIQLESTEEVADLLKLTLKIYHASIEVDLPVCLQETSSLTPWGTLFLQLVDKKVPGSDEDNVWWKTKKWAYRCLNRLFGKYGNPALQPLKTYADFAKSFVANFAPNILQTYLKQIDDWIKKEHWMSNQCLALSAAFFDDSIKHKITWKIIKPHIEVLVAQFIFPQLCFSAEDEQLWIEYPTEYVHKKIDPTEDAYSTQNTAITLLVDLVKYRSKFTFMSILGFANNILSQYGETPEDQKNGRDKDGALCMMGALSEEILEGDEEIEGMMEPFFVSHVLPEFKSRFPYLRARACHVTRSFSDLNFANEQNLAALYQSILDCLRDSELPVRVEAALALQSMTQYNIVREAMSPNLPFIMQELLNLTNELDIDTLANVMEQFVQVFAEQLTPFAMQLCTQLRDSFMRIMEELAQQNHDDSEESGDKTVAAMGILKTMGTLIISLESSPETIQQLENVILPVITYTLDNRMLDLYDEIFDIIDSCTFSAKQVSPTMWSLYDRIYAAFKETGADFMTEMFPALDNYIAYGKDVFANNEQARQMMFDVIETVMKSEQAGEEEKTCACKLMESVLLYCRGSVDMSVSPFMHLIFQYILTGQMKSTEFKVYCIEVVINCLYYNPLLTLHILEENQWTQGFFTLWFSTLDKFSRVHDKKLVIITLCSLLSLPADKIPVSLQSGWSQLLICIADVFQTLPKAIELREHMKKLYNEGYEEDDEEEDEEDNDEDDEGDNEEGEEDDDEADEEEDEDNEGGDDDDVEDEDAEYLEFLAQKAAEYNEGDEEDEEESDEDELCEEVLFDSPLDEIDPYICFEQVFRDMQHNRPDLYNHLTQGIDVEHQNSIMEIISTAEKNRSVLSTL